MTEPSLVAQVLLVLVRPARAAVARGRAARGRAARAAAAGRARRGRAARSGGVTRGRSGGTNGHQLHFDTDEAGLGGGRGGGAAEAPGGVERVLAASAHTRAHTRRRDRRARPARRRTPRAPRAWAVHPEERSVLLFEGDRLHGVLPGHADGGDAGERGGAPRGHRLTLMIGWWGRRRAAAGARASLLGPCGAMPRETRECTWPRLLRARATPTAPTTSTRARASSRARSARVGAARRRRARGAAAKARGATREPPRVALGTPREQTRRRRALARRARRRRRRPGP